MSSNKKKRLKESLSDEAKEIILDECDLHLKVGGSEIYLLDDIKFILDDKNISYNDSEVEEYMNKCLSGEIKKPVAATILEPDFDSKFATDDISKVDPEYTMNVEDAINYLNKFDEEDIVVFKQDNKIAPVTGSAFKHRDNIYSKNEDLNMASGYDCSDGDVAAMRAEQEEKEKRAARKASNPKVKVGDKIKIIKMEGEPKYTNKQGTIDHIDDIGQLHGTWGGLAVIPEEDIYELVVEESLTETSSYNIDLSAWCIDGIDGRVHVGYDTKEEAWEAGLKIYAQEVEEFKNNEDIVFPFSVYPEPDEDLFDDEDYWDELMKHQYLGEEKETTQSDRKERYALYHKLFDEYEQSNPDDPGLNRIHSWIRDAVEFKLLDRISDLPQEIEGQKVKYRFSMGDKNIYTDPYKEYIFVVLDKGLRESFDLEDERDILMKAHQYKCKLRKSDIEEALEPKDLIEDMEYIYNKLCGKYDDVNIRYWRFVEDGIVVRKSDGQVVRIEDDDFDKFYKKEITESWKKGDRVVLSTGETGTVYKDFDWQNEDQVAVQIDGMDKIKYPLSDTLTALKESNELEKRAKHHRKHQKGMSPFYGLAEAKKKKKPYSSINTNAGNVEHNVNMFNTMNNATESPSTNPTGPMVEALTTEPQQCFHISLTVNPELKWDRIYTVKEGGAKTLTVRYRKRSNDFAITETNPKYIFDDATLRFISESDAQQFIDKYVKLSNGETAKIKKSRPRELVQINCPDFPEVPLYTSLTYISRNAPSVLDSSNTENGVEDKSLDEGRHSKKHIQEVIDTVRKIYLANTHNLVDGKLHSKYLRTRSSESSHYFNQLSNKKLIDILREHTNFIVEPIDERSFTVEIPELNEGQESMTEGMKKSANEYTITYHKNTACRDRRPETPDDIENDWIEAPIRADSDLEALQRAIAIMDDCDIEDVIDDDFDSEESCISYLDEADWGDGSPIIIKVESSDKVLYDTGYDKQSWMDEYVDDDLNESISLTDSMGEDIKSYLRDRLVDFYIPEYFSEENKPNIDLVVTDIEKEIRSKYPQMIDYISCWANSDKAKEEGLPEDIYDIIASENFPEGLIYDYISKLPGFDEEYNIAESLNETRNDPYFKPYGYRDATKVLNGKAPRYYYHLKEIEMDKGDGKKLANYAKKIGLKVYIEPDSDPDYPIYYTDEYHWDDYFYPYPGSYSTEEGILFESESVDILEYDRISSELDKEFTVATPQECANMFNKPVKDGDTIYYPEKKESFQKTFKKSLREESANAFKELTSEQKEALRDLSIILRANRINIELPLELDERNYLKVNLKNNSINIFIKPDGELNVDEEDLYLADEYDEERLIDILSEGNLHESFDSDDEIYTVYINGQRYDADYTYSYLKDTARELAKDNPDAHIEIYDSNDLVIFEIYKGQEYDHTFRSFRESLNETLNVSDMFKETSFKAIDILEEAGKRPAADLPNRNWNSTRGFVQTGGYDLDKASVGEVLLNMLYELDYRNDSKISQFTEYYEHILERYVRIAIGVD